MHALLRTPLPLALLLLAACSQKEPQQPAGSAMASRGYYAAPDQAEIERLGAEGPEGLARRMVPNDLWLHYKLMEASGMVDALGGEDQQIETHLQYSSPSPIRLGSST